MDRECRKKWSKKHGHDTYGSDDSDEDGNELKPRRQKKHKGQVSTGGKFRACGATSHQWSNHRDCPYKKIRGAGVSSRLEDDKASENSDDIEFSENSLSDADGSSEGGVASSESDWCFEDDIISGNVCTCGAISRAHKTDCPLSSRNRYVGRTLFPKASSGNCQVDESGNSVAPEIHGSDSGSTQLGKRGSQVINFHQQKGVSPHLMLVTM